MILSVIKKSANVILNWDFATKLFFITEIATIPPNPNIPCVIPLIVSITLFSDLLNFGSKKDCNAKSKRKTAKIFKSKSDEKDFKKIPPTIAPGIAKEIILKYCFFESDFQSVYIIDKLAKVPTNKTNDTIVFTSMNKDKIVIAIRGPAKPNTLSIKKANRKTTPIISVVSSIKSKFWLYKIYRNIS